MNNFFDENLLNQKDTITFKKKRRIADNIESFLDEKLNNEKSIKEAYRNKDEVLKEEFNINIKERFIKEEKTEVLSEEAENILNDTEELLEDVLSEIVIRALNINEKLIEENREIITEKVKGFYELMEEHINLEASQLVINIVDKCKRCAESFDIELRESLFEDVDKIALILKSKVNNVINEEKILSELELLKEEENFSHPADVRLTLFKEMEIENVKLALKEAADNNRNLNKETILLMSYYETVVDYTMLEMFNTLKLITFETEMYKDQSRKRMLDFDIK